MNSGIFKTIILGLVLVVFSFVLGSQVTESRESALMLLGALCGIFFLLVLGKHTWWMLFIVMPLPRLIPLPGVLGAMPIIYSAALVVLPYWIIMWAMGYVRIRWRSMLLLDVAVFLFFAYLILSYCRHPVAINAVSRFFSNEAAETMGGKAYATAIFAFTYYLTLSIIPISSKDLHKVLKITYIVTAIAILINLPASLTGTIRIADSERASGMQPTGWFIVGSLLCAYPFSTILFSAWRLAGLMLGFFFVSMSGFRSILAYQVALLILLSVARRQIGCVLLAALCSLACIYWASSEKLLLHLPLGTQRVLAVLPKVEIDPAVEREASHSSEWRYVMWRWALDPRTGYIRDYVWGDGLGLNVYEMQLMAVQEARGKVGGGDQRMFAAKGLWHNGAIDAIHRLGIVGLVLISLLWFAGIYAFFRMFASSWKTSFGFFLAYFTCAIVSSMLGYYTAAGTTNVVLTSIRYIALIKVGWCLLREEGILQPLFQRKIYIPLAIREHEAAESSKAFPPAT